METIHQISNRFFLLKKRMRDFDVKELSTKSNLSFINSLKLFQTKKINETVKPVHKFILETSKKPEPSDIISNQKVQFPEKHILSPAVSISKTQDKKKPKKPQTVNKIPRDDLINIAFDKNALKYIQPLPIKIDPPKQAAPIIEEIKDKNKVMTQVIELNPTLIIHEEILDNKMNGMASEVKDEADNQSSNLFCKELSHRNNEEDDDEANDKNNLDYYDKKEEIFDSNYLFNDDDDLLEDNSFKDDNNVQTNVFEPKEDIITIKVENKDNLAIQSMIKTTNELKPEISNETGDNIIKEKDVEADNDIEIDVGFNDIQEKLISDNENEYQNEGEDKDEQINDEDMLGAYNSKVIIPLQGFENFDFNKYNDMNMSNDNDDDEGNNLQRSRKESANEDNNKNENIVKISDIKPREKVKDNKKKISININPIKNNNKKNNKIVDDDDEDEDYICIDYNKEKKVKPSYIVESKDKTNEKNNQDSPLVTITDTRIKLSLKPSLIMPATSQSGNETKIGNNRMMLSNPSNSLKKDNIKVTPTINHSIHTKSDTNLSSHQSKSITIKNTPSEKNLDSEVTYSHYHHHHHHNSNINNITVINNTIIPPSSNSLQLFQSPSIVHDLKKKEYDILCLSILNNLLIKIQKKLTSSTEQTSSSTSKDFNDMINMTLQLGKEDQSKRIKLITEKTMKMVITLFSIFEQEKKRDQYLYDILEILDVIDNFQHKTKSKYGEKIPQWFKTLKLVFKYIVSLFKMKGYSTDHMKNLINQDESNNKIKNLIKFTKTFKSFNNSVEKLKKLLSKDSTKDKKQRKLNEELYIYLESNPNSIEYSKCFKVSKNFIRYIFEYLSTRQSKE